MHKLLGFDTENWCTEYVVCHSIYEYDDCYDDCIDTLANGFKESKKCRHVAHPQQRQRSECGHLLLKKQYVKKATQSVPIQISKTRNHKVNE